jgi:hypothetical protein
VTGFVSVKLWKTLMTPFFCPTKIRPSGANCSTTGLVSPLNTTTSRNPVGRVDAAAGPGCACATTAAPSTIATAMTSRRHRVALLIRPMSPSTIRSSRRVREANASRQPKSVSISHACRVS